MPRSALVTRPEPAAAVTAARLIALGWHPVLAPMLHIHPIGAELPPARALQAVLVTSAVALAELPDSYFDIPLLAVGAATARRARERGFAQVRSADGTAQDLAALAVRCCLPGGEPLLLAHGAGHGDRLAAGLEAHGFTISRAPVYETQPATALPAPAAAAWCDATLQAALFFSAETARAFVDLILANGWGASAAATEALAIAPGAAAALAPLPWRRVRVADRPDHEAMLALLQ